MEIKECFYRRLTRKHYKVDLKRLGVVVDKLLTIGCIIAISIDVFTFCIRFAEVARVGPGAIGGEYLTIFIIPVLYMLFHAIRDVLK